MCNSTKEHSLYSLPQGLFSNGRGTNRAFSLVLIGVAAAICAAPIPHMMTKPCVSKPAEAQRPVACSPQWLPVLLASSVHRPTPVGFSWDALNVTNATQCAGKKCYFPSQRKGEGWLVGRPSCLRRQCRDATGRLGRNQIPEMAPPTRWFPPYTRAWALAEELRANFGIFHLMRGPPLLATLPEAQATYMNAKIRALDRKKHPRWQNWKIANVKQYFAAGLLSVQGVRACSYPECMLLRCAPLTARAIEGFVANAPNRAKLSQGIQQSFALFPAMVKAHPCLKIDFQVYLRNDGAVLNIDLDRCDELNPGTREPLNASQELELAQIPGLCQRGSGQAFLNEALGQVYERLRQ